MTLNVTDNQYGRLF